jgi:uncharacterized membrane protein YozB (DUF420 family)
MKNLKSHLILLAFTLPVMAHAQQAGKGIGGVKTMMDAGQDLAKTLVVGAVNIGELMFIAFMLVNVLIGIALERQGHKEVTKDVMVGSFLITLPTIINSLIKLLASGQFDGLWF